MLPMLTGELWQSLCYTADAICDPLAASGFCFKSHFFCWTLVCCRGIQYCIPLQHRGPHTAGPAASHLAQQTQSAECPRCGSDSELHMLLLRRQVPFIACCQATWFTMIPPHHFMDPSFSVLCCLVEFLIIITQGKLQGCQY